MPDQDGTVAAGFIGLGDIGKPMAVQLARSSAVTLTVFDLNAAPVAELVAEGATAADSVSDLARRSAVISIMVRDDDQVRAVLADIVAAASAGTVVVVHSTVAPKTPAELAAVAAKHDLSLLDAPVSGGAMGARAGTLAFMVGGPAAALDSVRPVLQAMAGHIVHAGPVGAGTAFKLARNLMHFVSYTAATEAQRLAEAAGLDLIELGKVVRYTDSITGGPGAIMHRETTAELSPDDFWFKAFAPLRILAEKDLSFAIELADGLGVEVPLARLAKDRLAPGLGLPSPE